MRSFFSYSRGQETSRKYESSSDLIDISLAYAWGIKRQRTRVYFSINREIELKIQEEGEIYTNRMGEIKS